MLIIVVVYFYFVVFVVMFLWSGVREFLVFEFVIVWFIVRCFNCSSGVVRVFFIGVDLGKCRVWRRGLIMLFRCVVMLE